MNHPKQETQDTGINLSDEQLAEVERALNETVERIEASAAAQLESSESLETVQSILPASVKRQLKEHYRNGFKTAVANHRVWDKDRNEVLERADHVGYLSAQIALGLSIFESIKDSGAGVAPGGDVHVRRVRRPQINWEVAKAAAQCIDCVEATGEDEKGNPIFKISWEWCSGSRKSPDVWIEIFRRALATGARGRN